LKSLLERYARYDNTKEENGFDTLELSACCPTFPEELLLSVVIGNNVQTTLKSFKGLIVTFCSFPYQGFQRLPSVASCPAWTLGMIVAYRAFPTGHYYEKGEFELLNMP
jgi:hypothetical protein